MGEENGGGPGVFNNAAVLCVDRGSGVSFPQHRHSAIRLTIEPFTLGTQKWNVYQRLEQPFIVDDVKKKALRLTSFGSALRDVVVISLLNPKIQSAFLAVNSVTWDSALTFTTSMVCSTARRKVIWRKGVRRSRVNRLAVKGSQEVNATRRKMALRAVRRDRHALSRPSCW